MDTVMQIVNEYEARISKGFQEEKGKNLIKGEILECCEPGRPLFARTYSYSIINFALRVFYLQEKEYYEEANQALIENCKVYIDNKECRDDRDSFYWSIDLFCRIVEYYGSMGSVAPGRLSYEAEQYFLEMAYVWCKNNSDLKRAEYHMSKTWNVWESENHHVQGFTTCWQLSKLLMRSDTYKHKPYDDGKVAEEHYTVWNEYIKVYLSERGKKSLFVEIANGDYGTETLKGIYNVYDFSEDRKLKDLANSLLTLYWACWAQEQLNGVRGGGKTRVYPEWLIQGKDGLLSWAWYYFGIGERARVRGNDYTMMTSTYRIPELIVELARNPQERGTYEIKQRPLGLAKDGYYINPDYHLETEWGGIYRYTYVTPQFIIGSLLVKPRPATDWTLISSQNRFQGVIFASHQDARIVPVPECMTSDHTPIMRSYNQHYAVQKKGTLITQKLRESVDVGVMRVWLSKAGGLDDVVSRGQWIFTKTEGSYAAIGIVEGGYTIKQENTGSYIICNNEWSPVILEVVKEEDYDSFEQFMEQQCTHSVNKTQDGVTYTSMYEDVFVFPLQYSFEATINGNKAVEKIKEAFDSPFVQELWDDGIVTIKKGSNQMKLDFRLEDNADETSKLD